VPKSRPLVEAELARFESLIRLERIEQELTELAKQKPTRDRLSGQRQLRGNNKPGKRKGWEGLHRRQGGEMGETDLTEWCA